MGGIGGKGKGARRRQKLVSEAKSFDKKTGTFRCVPLVVSVAKSSLDD
jgi:hypothetical protein